MLGMNPDGAPAFVKPYEELQDRIDRAVRDINAETDLIVDWEKTNPGRKTTDIEFSIKKQVALRVVD